MNPRFVALPVGQGDAFFYQQKNLNLLVDGGRGRKNFPGLFKAHLKKINTIDVAICTHSDADHTNGIIGLLETWEVPIKEIWLPGSWSYKLKQLLENEEEFYHELYNNINDLNGEDLNKKDIDSLENLKLIPEYDEINFSKENNEDFDFSEVCENRKESYPFFSYIYLDYGRSFYKNKSKQNLFIEAVKAASRIKEIVCCAYDQGVKIRWFDFQEFKQKGHKPDGGKRGILEPVNSREISPKSIGSSLTILKVLYLSVANKESLVFTALEERNEPTVLFTADSDLNFTIPDLKPNNSIIVTAPHHGSENNKNAYDKIESWHTSPNKIVWVRSDSQSKKRPGKSFLQVQGDRYCTLCNSGTHPKQTVIFTNKLSSWRGNTNARSCNCT